jgi:polysaccharide chain length determinant protein (PEP-CTERM system associated)
VLPGKKYTPEDVLHILWSRKWLVVVPVVVTSVATAVLVRKLPATYRSESLIQVVPQRIPENYVKSTVTTRIEDRLGAIQQVVLSRSKLESVIRDFNLYPVERQNNAMEDVVARMRTKDINVKVERGDAFRVSYIAGDAQTAKMVAERLATLFIDENIREREALANQTNQFLEAQLEDAKRRLVEHEKKLEAYQRLHAGELPTQVQVNLQAIQNAQMQVQTLSESLNRDRERKNLLERQIADLENTPEPATIALAQPGTDAIQPASTAQQLEAANLRLQAAQLRYTGDHPDVIALKKVIGELEAKLAREGADGSTSAVTAPVKPMTAAEALRQNRLRALRADLQNVDRQISHKQAAELRLREVMAGYQAKVDAAPTREAELIELTRDYSTLQTMYTTLLSKREDSKIAANVERQQIGEQFRILDPARLPERPFSPDRLKIMVAGSALGLFVGLGLIGLLEYRDSSFRTEEEVQRVLQLPVLALVPTMASERERRLRRRRKLLVGAAGVVMLASSVAAVVLWKLQNL